jgi:hypothetical protein
MHTKDHSSQVTHFAKDHPTYNLLVQWTSGEESREPLAAMIKDNPIMVAAYAKENKDYLTLQDGRSSRSTQDGRSLLGW